MSIIEYNMDCNVCCVGERFVIERWCLLQSTISDDVMNGSEHEW